MRTATKRSPLRKCKNCGAVLGHCRPNCAVEHTPTPWHVGHEIGCFGGNRVWNEEKEPVLVLVPFGQSPPDVDRIAQANGAFIVRACNAHDVLVSALREIASGSFGGNPLTRDAIEKIARDALVKVAP